jgi:hypothetical protein
VTIESTVTAIVSAKSWDQRVAQMRLVAQKHGTADHPKIYAAVARAALVLIKVVDADGGVRLSLAYSDGMDWITRLGMLTAATASETPDPSAWQDQEDHP